MPFAKLFFTANKIVYNRISITHRNIEYLYTFKNVTSIKSFSIVHRDVKRQLSTFSISRHVFKLNRIESTKYQYVCPALNCEVIR